MSTEADAAPPHGTYFISGASGFIGAHLTRRLVAAGCDVIAADRSPVTATPGVTPVRCDIRDRASVEQALDGRTIKYAVHLAAKVGDFGARAEFHAANVVGTRNVLEGLSARGVTRIVHFSSIAAMGFDPGASAGEDAPLSTDGDAYSATKAEGELVARDLQRRGAPIVIIRPGDVYGPGSIPWVVRPVAMLRKRQMFFVDGGSGHFGHVYVDNLLDGVLLALANPAAEGRAYILTDDEQDTSFRTYFTRLAIAVGAPAPRISVPKPAALLLGAMVEQVARVLGVTPPFTRTAVHFVTKGGSYSIARAKAELGYSPRIKLDEGLDRIRDAYRSGG